jgi:cytochrome b561
MKVTRGYSGAQIALHWLIAGGVLFNYIVSSGMGRALRQRLEAAEVTVPIAGLHVWVGVAVLVLAALRIGLRLVRGGPAQEPGAMGKVASVVHGLLYVLMLAVPVSGAMAWFGGVEAAGDPHELMVNLLILLAGAHALAALFHHYVMKDGVLKRMLRPA